MNKQQLAAKIWASANEMRSKIEASEYKDYILGFIFYKYLSEREEEFLRKNGLEEDKMKDVTEDNSDIVSFVQNSIGYFIAYENLYSTWISKGSDFDVSNVSDALSAFNRLIFPRYRRVFDRIFETLETGLSKLGDTSGARTKAIRGLLHLIKDIPMDSRQGYDVLGYIYEYLISNFAANAGKKAGEFYTPHEVSMLMSEIVASHLSGRKQIQIYDPTSGSGSLLINIGAAVSKRMGDKNSIKYYAQELKENTYNLTRMNLVMRGIKVDNIETRNGDTLEEDWPFFEEGHPETYDPLFVDAVVSNPPYSQRWDPVDKEVDPRFNGFGLAPKSKADYAFLLHDLFHLQPEGIMTIVLPHGVLFRGGEEGEIRKNLVERGHIDAIIGLPANIFFGTGIPTIIMVLKKRRDANDILVIDASKGFIKEGKNNKLRASDIKRIVDAYEKRPNIDRFCRCVSIEEVRSNDYNLNIPRYVDSSEPAESWDIYSTMFGGIPYSEIEGMDHYWSAFPSLKDDLFDASGLASMVLKVDSIEEVINNNKDVIAYRDEFERRFDGFDTYLYEELIDETVLVNRASEEEIIADEIFTRLSGFPLVDPYTAYQALDDEWEKIVVDLEILQTEKFDSAKRVDPNMEIKKKNGKKIEVQSGWSGRVLPFSLVQKLYLQSELDDVTKGEARLQSITQELGELFDTLSEEDKQDAEDAVKEDAFVAKKVPKMVKVLRSENPSDEDDEESLLARLVQVSHLIEEEKQLKRDLKKQQASLEEKTKEFIENMSDDEVLECLQAKWIQPLLDRMAALPSVAIDELVSKLGNLSKKYETTLADIDSQIQQTERELSSMLGQLTGNEHDLAGLKELQALLGGGR